MNAEKEAEILKSVDKAKDVILNIYRKPEDVISANVLMTNALADIQYELDTGYAAICTRAECKDKPTAFINRLYKSEMATEHRFKTIVRGLKNTLRNMEYGIYK